MLATALSQLVRPAQTAVRHAPFSASAALWKGKTVTQQEPSASLKLQRLQQNAPAAFVVLLARARGVAFNVFSFDSSSNNVYRKMLETHGFVEPNGDIVPRYADVFNKWISK